MSFNLTKLVTMIIKLGLENVWSFKMPKQFLVLWEVKICKSIHKGIVKFYPDASNFPKVKKVSQPGELL